MMIAIATQTGLALGMLLAVMTHRVYAGFRHWTAYFALTPVCFYLLSLRGLVPDFLAVVIGNTLAPLAVAYLHEGTHRFLGIEGRAPWKVNAPITLLAMAGFVWFTYFQSYPAARIFVSCASISLICLHAGIAPRLLIRGRPPSALSLLTISLIAFGLFSLFRGINALYRDVPDIFLEGWTLNTFIMLLIALSAANMMGCILMTYERALGEASEARRALETLVANLRGVAYRVRLGGEQTIDYVSEGVAAVSGYKPEKFVGKPLAVFRELQNPEDQEANQAALERAFSGDGRYAVTYRLRSADGRTLWVWDQGQLVRDEEGRYAFREGFISDVTDRVRAEEERERLLAELRRATGDVKALTGLIPICMSCKKIRDDKGYWNSLEKYVREHTDADFTHGICPECADRLYPLK